MKVKRLDEYIWNEGEDTLVYELDGVEKRIKLSANMILTRACHTDQAEFLIGKIEDESQVDRRLDHYIEKIKSGYCNFVEVLAVGKGRQWTSRERRKYGVAANWSTPARVGDFLLMPEQCKWGRLWRYILGKPYLHICESHVPLLLITGE